MEDMVAHTCSIEAWEQQQQDFFKSDANYGLFSEFQSSQGDIVSFLKKIKKIPLHILKSHLCLDFPLLFLYYSTMPQIPHTQSESPYRSLTSNLALCLHSG